MSAFLIIGIACWLAIVVVILAVLRAASHADDITDLHAHALEPGSVPLPLEPITEPPGQGRRRWLAIAEAASVALVVVLAVQLSEPADWSPPALTGLLAVLAVAGDLRAFRATRFRISASFPALVVAMALLGPAPAV